MPGIGLRKKIGKPISNKGNRRIAVNEISTQALALLLALAAGMLLGAIFFGGLWWTVHTGMTARRPALWFICSMMLRIGIVTMGFYFLLSLSGNSWEILLGSLFGFILARL